MQRIPFTSHGIRAIVIECMHGKLSMLHDRNMQVTPTVTQAEQQVTCRHNHFEARAHSVQVVPTVYKCDTRDGRVRAHDGSIACTACNKISVKI
jgi:Zn finger protein HypA/HybF involved in hydrogenase expression